MESLAALGLAANILQVVDFTANLLSTGKEIYQRGSTVQNSELEVVVKDLTSLNDPLKSWARPNPDALGPLARESQVRKLLSALAQ